MVCKEESPAFMTDVTQQSYLPASNIAVMQSVPSHRYFGAQKNGGEKKKKTSGRVVLFLVYRKEADAQSSYSHKGGIQQN